MNKHTRRRPPLEQLLLGAWMRKARLTRGWSQQSVVIAINAIEFRPNRPYKRHSVTGWEYGDYLPSKKVVQWYESTAPFGLEKHFLLELLHRARIARGEPPPSEKSEEITAAEAATFRDWNLEVWQRRLNDGVSRRPETAVSVPPWDRFDSRPFEEAGCRLAISHGPLVGLYGGSQGTRQLIAESADILRAIDLALERGDPTGVQAIAALGGYTWLRGVTLKHFTVRAMNCASDDDQRADALNAIGLSALGTSDHLFAHKCFALVPGLHATDPKHVARSLLGRAEVALRQFDDDAHVLLVNALTLFTSRSDPVGVAHCELALTQLALRAGELGEAADHLRAADMGYNGRDRLGEVNCVKGRGDVAWRRGDHRQAHAHFIDAFHGYTSLGYVLGRAHCTLKLAELDLVRGRHDNAQEGVSTASQVYTRIGNQLGRANCTAAQAQIALRQAKPRAARRRFQRAHWRYDDLGCEMEALRCTARLGDLTSSVGGRADRSELVPEDLWTPDDNG